MTDIYWQNDATGEVVVWTMNGTTKVSEHTVSINPGLGWTIAGTGNLIGAFANQVVFNSGTEVGIWSMDDGYEPILATSADPTTRIITLGIGNVVGMYGSKLYLQDPAGGDITIWTIGPDSNGDPEITNTETLMTPGADWTFKAVFDTEIIIQHKNGNVVVCDGYGDFQFAGTNPGLENWKIAGMVDLTGNARGDIIWELKENDSSVIPVVWQYRIVDSAYMRSFLETAPNMHIKAIADFDGDNESDLLWQSTINGSGNIWITNGTTIVNKTNIGSPS